MAGRVKTRLGRLIGMRKAAAVYRDLIRRTVKQVQLMRVRREVVVWCDPPSAVSRMRRFMGKDFRYRGQRGRDLGVRMSLAFRRAFQAGADRVVIIGTDCPGMTASVLNQAFFALRRSPMVIGPSLDGGYYLLGLREMVPPLFHGVKWSTPIVLRQTMSKAKRMGLRVKFLASLRDVDTLEDLNSV